MCLALAGCQRAPDTRAAAQAGTAASTPAAAGASPGIRPDGDTELDDRHGEDPERRSEEGLHLHRRACRRTRREPAEVDSAAEHLQLRRRHSGIGRDGQGLLRAARMPGVARLRRRPDRVGIAGQPGRLRQVRRRRREDAGHLLDVRHDAGHAAGRVDCAALRRSARRAGAVQEGADRPRRDQLQGAADGPVECADVDQGDHRASCR